MTNDQWFVLTMLLGIACALLSEQFKSRWLFYVAVFLLVGTWCIHVLSYPPHF